MIYFFFLALPLIIPSFFGWIETPFPGLFSSTPNSHQIQCVPVSESKFQSKFSSDFNRANSKKSAYIVDALHCKKMIFSPGERTSQQETILANLSQLSVSLSKFLQKQNVLQHSWIIKHSFADVDLGKKIVNSIKIELSVLGETVIDSTENIDTQTVSWNTLVSESHSPIYENWCQQQLTLNPLNHVVVEENPIHLNQVIITYCSPNGLVRI